MHDDLTSTLRSSLLATLLLCGPALAQFPEQVSAELDHTSRDYDQIHLALTLEPDLDRATLRATARLSLASMVDGLSTIRLHAVDLQVEEVTAGEEALEHASRDGLLLIRLSSPLALGEEVTLEIRYQAQPRQGMYFFRPSERHPSIPYQVWTQGEGTNNRHWIPCYDLPDDRLTSELRVTVPDRFQTLSNGVRRERLELEDGRVQDLWRQELPHVTYLITLVIGEFAVEEGLADTVPLTYWVPPGWEPQVEEIFGRTPAMLEWFTELTGTPYPWPAYAQVTVWDFSWGGMENTGATTLNMRALHGPGVRPDYSADGLVAHELAHQWYGDLITCRTFGHLWLNEGFATYCTSLWFEAAEGTNAFQARHRGTRRSYMNGTDLQQRAQEPRPGPGECGDIRAHAYVKGASVLHMLRQLLGERSFREALQHYTHTRAHRSIVTAELQRALEEHSGLDLSWFFEQWVHGSGHPVLQCRHEWEKEAGVLHLRVSQVQPCTDAMPLFRVPLEVAWVLPDGERVERRLECFRATHEWRFPCAAAPVFVRFDPDGWLLARLEELQSLQQWGAQLTRDTSIIGRLEAAEALGGLGTGAIPFLAQAASRDTQHEVRSAAATALGQIPGEQATGALLAAASDQDSRVRATVVEALGHRPAHLVQEVLRLRLQEDTSHHVCAAAARALARCRAPETFTLLVEALGRESHRDVIRQQALEGLAELGDPRALPHALTFVDYRFGRGRQHRLRHAALDAMVTLGRTEAGVTPEVQERLLALCADPYFRMRRWALEHVARLGLPAARPLAARLAQEDPDRGVQAAARQVLETLRDRE